MKKILLLAALAAGVFSAQAEKFGDVFKVQIGHKNDDNQFVIADKVYESGAVIDIPTYEDEMRKIYPDEAFKDWWGTYNCGCDIVVTNISDEPWQVGYSKVNIDPTAAVAESAEYGFGICYSFYNNPGMGSCKSMNDGEVFIVDFEEIVPGGSFVIETHQQQFTNLAPVTFQINIYLCTGGELYGDDDFEATIEFSHTVDTTAGVGAIASDTTAEYYNLQGVRVTNPENGLFIRKQNGKTSKVIL